MIEARRGFGHESDVLIRQLDGHLASLRVDRNRAEVALAERVADALRRLVAETLFASAADRARVRAAVHYFVLRRGDRRWGGALSEDVRVVNAIMATLGRDDLLVTLAPELA